MQLIGNIEFEYIRYQHLIFMKDYYKILGISPLSTQEDIKARFRFLSHAFHPDKFTTLSQRKQAEEMFKKKNEAYQVLSAMESRTRYDKERVIHFSEVKNHRDDKIGQIPHMQKPKSLKQILLIVFGFLTMVILLEKTVFDLSSFKRSLKEYLEPIYTSTALASLDKEGLNNKSSKRPLSISWKPCDKQFNFEGYIMKPGNTEEVLLKEGNQKLINDIYENISELCEGFDHHNYDNATVNICCMTRMLTMKMAKLYGIQILKDYPVGKKQLAQKDLNNAKKTISEIYKTLLAYSSISSSEGLVAVVKTAQSNWYQMEKMLSLPPSNSGFLDVLDISDRLLADNEMMTSYVESLSPVPISKIIHMSGRQQMYAQKLARDYLAASIGIDKEYRVDLMLDSAVEFESAMLMMECVTENTAKIKGLIKSITKMEWRKVYKAATECIESNSTEFNVLMMMKLCDTLSGKTNRLTTLYVAVAKDIQSSVNGYLSSKYPSMKSSEFTRFVEYPPAYF